MAPCDWREWLFRGAENSAPQRFHAPLTFPLSGGTTPPDAPVLPKRTARRRSLGSVGFDICSAQPGVQRAGRHVVAHPKLLRASCPTAFAAVFPAFHYVEPLASSHRDATELPLSFFTNLNPWPPMPHSLLRLILSCSLRFCRARFLHPSKVFVDRSIPYILYF